MKFVAALVTLGLGVLMATSAVAAPRLVVGELFTNTYCPPCASFDPALDEWNVANQGDFALVCLHGWWPGYGDVFWQADSLENRPRINYYGADYAPHFRMDGIADLGSNIAPGTWSATVAARQSVSAPLTIDLSTTYTSGSRSGVLTATITNVSGATVNGNFRMAVVESIWYHTAGGNGYDGNNAAVRDLLPSVTGTPISLAPSASTVINQPYNFPLTAPPAPAIDPNHVQLICWVQDASKEILQGARVFFPIDQPFLALGPRAVSVLPGGDGDAYLDAGEGGSLVVTVKNVNQGSAASVTALLTSGDPYVTITDGTATYGTIAAYSSASNGAEPFTFTISPSAPSGYTPQFRLTLTTGALAYTKALFFRLDVGSPGDFSGPAGVYYAYENSDNYTESPTYAWYEIDPTIPHDAVGTQILPGDETATFFALPFHLKFYGTVYDTVSASSNGWVAMGRQLGADPSPSTIPDADGPFGMIAAFWGDLDPSAAGSGKIYRYYDAAGHRYIFEWSSVAHFDNPALKESFQVILMDPAFNPTATGDAEVIVQYKNVADAGAGVAGIENIAESSGILYSFFGDANPAAVGMVSGRAVKYTPDAPTRTDVPHVGGGSGAALLMAASPNPFTATTQIAFRVPARQSAALKVYGVDGRFVTTLFDGVAEAGMTQTRWNGLDAAGHPVAAGLYFARLETSGETQVGKVMVLR